MTDQDLYEGVDTDNELGDPDDSPVIRQLRKQNKELAAKAKDRDELAEKLAGFEVKELVTEAKLDLNADQMSALFAVHQGDRTPEALRTTAVRLGFAQAEAENPDEAAQRKLNEASAGARVTGVEGHVTAEEFSGWDTPRRADFLTRHPGADAAFLRGEAVRV